MENTKRKNNNDKNTTDNKKLETLIEKEYRGIIYYIKGDEVYDSEKIIQKEKGEKVGRYEKGEIKLTLS